MCYVVLIFQTKNRVKTSIVSSSTSEGHYRDKPMECSIENLKGAIECIKYTGDNALAGSPTSLHSIIALNTSHHSP